MKAVTALCILTALMFSSVGTGQLPAFVFDKFNEDDGLPNNEVSAIYQDASGILWMSSLDGLISYNGYDFRSYRHHPGDSSTLSSNRINAMFEDRQGRLWIGTFASGLNVSNTSKSAFQRIVCEAVRSQSIEGISQDAHGNMWLIGDAGLELFRFDSGALKTDSTLNQIAREVNQHGSPTALYKDRHDNMWIGSTSGILCFDMNTQQLLTPQNTPGFTAKTIDDIEEDQRSILWISTRGPGPRLFHLHEKTATFIPFNELPVASSTRTLLFDFDLDGRLWATVFGDQLYGYDFRDSSLFLSSSDNSNIDQERFMRDPFVDHEGNVWIPGEGFYRFAYPRGFYQYVHPFGFHQSSACIGGVDGDIWFAYREHGIVIYDPSNNSVRQLSTRSDTPERLFTDHVQDILQLSNGYVAMAGFGALMLYDPKRRRSWHTPVAGTCRAVYEDSKQRLWFAGFKGLYEFTLDGVEQNFYSLPTLLGDPRNFIETIVESPDGHIWFGSEIKGLARLDPETGAITQFLPDPAREHTLPSVKIIDLAADSTGLWIATDAGLVRMDFATETFTTYGTEVGFSNDFINSIVQTQEGLWLSTNDGLVFLNTDNMHCDIYTTSDGLSNRSYAKHKRYRATDGTIYFGGKNGVDYFHPHHLRNVAMDVPIVALNIKVDQREVDVPGLDTDKPIVLHHADDVIEIEIAALTYYQSENVEYAYRLEGLSEQWIDLGKNRMVIIANLEPGSYQFRAKARHPHHEWSADELHMPIIIKPPFWGTWWFRTLSALLAAGTVLGIIYYREKRIKQREQKETEIQRAMMELEKRALLAQMNPHFIFNAMNSIQQFIASRDVEGAMKYLSKFSRLLRIVLNISREHRITLSDELTLIKDYLELENMRFPNKFEYEISVDPDIDIHAMEIPPFLIQPQVENAIRHGLMNKGSQGQLKINISKMDDHIKIRVEDNGIGREAARKLRAQSSFHQGSKGLTIVEERLRHLNKNTAYHKLKITDIYNGEKSANGTRVEIFVPID